MDYAELNNPSFVEEPHWLGRSDIHASHRSRLLFKGKVDILGKRIRSQSGVRGANAWLKSRGFKELNTFRQAEYDEVTEILNSIGVPAVEEPNYYLQFGWKEPDNLEYVWPNE